MMRSNNKASNAGRTGRLIERDPSSRRREMSITIAKPAL